MADLATAYLRLIPSLKGAQGTIENELEGATKKGGDKASKSFGSSFKAGVGKIAIGNFLGNALTQGASMAVDGFVSVVKDSFEQASTFEQLSGGVEKIFDQANISGIMEDAQNAYKTLNMSANDYLASINQVGAAFAQTMGDQAGYDTAKTGMQAIADYASGTGRNLDELNEKYALITRSTSSYQSIADQFSGILPATSADFLAQAQAAGFLSSEYTKLTEVPVAEYQAAVTSMLQKGVADMGLAGNTMAESTNTISGSIAMTQAAWENFLLAIGNPNVDTTAAIDNLVMSFQAAAQNIGPQLGIILQSIGELLGQLVAYILTHIPDIIAAAGQLIMGLVSGIVNGIAPTMAAFEQVVNSGLAAIGTFFMNALMAGIELVTNIANGITSAVGSVIEAITSTVQGAVDAAANFVGSMFSAGANLIQGFIDGIGSMIGGVADAITGGIGGAVNGLMGFLGIASPSKLFAYIGEMSMQGLIVGTDSMTSDVQNAMQGAIDDVYGTAKAQADIAVSAASDTGALSTGIGNMGVYIDGRALVGYIAPNMNVALGRLY